MVPWLSGRPWGRIALTVCTVLGVIATTTGAVAPRVIQPAIWSDFPDPAVIVVRGNYYAYSTASRDDGSLLHVPVRRSASLFDGWSTARDALPGLPEWVDHTPLGQGSVWAPAITAVDRNRYLLYFTARSARRGAQCLGVAWAAHPEGPFHPASRPLLCRPDDLDEIDPAPFTDRDGTRYLLYSASRAGNATIWLQRLTGAGTRLVGVRRPLLRADRLDEDHIVEAPALVRRNGRYELFYSGNAFNSGHYFVNYAVASSLWHTFVKHPGELLNQHTLRDVYQNPGGQDVLRVHHRDFLIFHAYTGPVRRSMFVVELDWLDHTRPVLRLGHAAPTDLD